MVDEKPHLEGLVAFALDDGVDVQRLAAIVRQQHFQAAVADVFIDHVAGVHGDPVVPLGQAQDGFAQVGVEIAAHVHAVQFAVGARELPMAGGRLELVDQAVVLFQVFGAPRAAMGVEVLARGDQQLGDHGDLVGDLVAVAQPRGDAQRQVHVFGDEVAASVVDEQRDLDFGVGPQKGLHGRREMHGAEGGRGADADASAGALHGAAHQVLEVLDGVGKEIGILQQHRAAFGEADALGVAVEKLGFELGFQPGDFFGDGRAAGAQAFGGLGKAQAFGHFDEDLHALDRVHCAATCVSFLEKLICLEPAIPHRAAFLE
ncbi:hypothetical protein AXA74_20750 [Bordetella hinzii LMG 13501]|nr:hypothetical protein AXA74_20750 [Bordetella hinzii LMG 13501]